MSANPARWLKPRGIVVPRRSLVRPHTDIWHYDFGKADKRVYERGRNPSSFRVYSFYRSPKAAYKGTAASPPWGLHYQGPSVGGFTREIFLATGINNWNALAASIDVLLVGGGGGGIFEPDSSFGFGGSAGGSGGGGIVVQLGVAVTLGNLYEMIVATGGVGAFNTTVGASAGGDSLVREGFAPFGTIAGPAGGGGVSGGLMSPGVNGQPMNGSGGGGGGNFFDGLWPPTTADGAGFDGGAGVTSAVAFNENAGGGGGGAGALGQDAAAGSPATPGNGGDGAIPANSSFGAWGLDIGEAGFFGGGGWGRNGDVAAWANGNPGLGNGADNTGGGGGPAAPPTNDGEDGRSGIVAIIYAS